MTPEEFYAHAMQAADAEGRLPLARMAGWEVFPFEPGSLRVVPLAPPSLPEHARHAEDGADCRAIESLPHIARAHVSRWGDGSAHVHVFFFARPAGFPQLRGTCLALWDDLLPAVPDGQRDADATEVARIVAAAHGGTAHLGATI
jgi:hypothetical protein